MAAPNPEINDPVLVRYRTDSGIDTTMGTLGVELDGSGRAIGVVVSTDGGAVSVAASQIVSIERDGDRRSLEERVQDLPVSELLGMLEDAEGESSSCDDDECRCHLAPGVIRDEIASR